ncbi:MAG TPA: N-acetyltransferase [Gammaproteobacteria bacterium]|nr:N-acetyltransferase [Gammaproteobacteria bacterium]
MADIAATEWDALAAFVQADYPFTRHAFLAALEESDCVCEQSGWVPEHVMVRHGTTPVAAMPMYRKLHSWGEYVFDQGWAQAYDQHGRSYYPKLVTAIPFTPCVGPRLLCSAAVRAELWPRLLVAIKAYCDRESISSWHLLFSEDREYPLVIADHRKPGGDVLDSKVIPLTHSGASKSASHFVPAGESKPIVSTDLLLRTDVQFQWFNRGYTSFAEFLQRMSSSKRKKIKRERRRITEAGIEIRRLSGDDLDSSVWQQFYNFYAATYLKRGRLPYLSRACFEQWAQSLRDQMLLVMAYQGRQPVAAALSFFDHQTLYGRYWGCLEEYHSLHFETCYYQGIDFCIERGLQRFDSGAQGEHKIARGFEAVITTSLHWLREPEFRQAIGRFLEQESCYMAQYQQAANDALPFRDGMRNDPC